MAWHTASEFLGMSRTEAQAWAGALGWEFRDMTDHGWHTDDQSHSRINVWFDESGHVERAAIY